MKYPLKISWKTEIIPLLILILSFGLGFYFYQNFPEQVITHWSFAGNPDGYAGKLLGAFFLPLTILAIYVLFLLLPFIDPKKDRYGEFQKTYHTLKTVFLLVFFCIFAIAGLVNLGYQLPIVYIIPIFVGILMIVIGNFMGKIKNNWFIGIRTPWTLSSENVWNKTHRLGGWLFVFYGIILMITPFLGYALGEGVIILATLLLIAITLVYSYVIYRKEK